MQLQFVIRADLQNISRIFSFAQVQIIQAGVVERCVSSTHIYTFDGIVYENPFEGTFILYKHSTLPYEVQIHRKPCSHASLCNCGVAVRFGDVMIAADICTTGKLRFWSYTLDGSYIEPSKIVHLPQIIRLDEGRSFQVIMDVPHLIRVAYLFVKRF